MPELVWLASAENDLLGIFAELEDRRQGSGEEFLGRLSAMLEHVRRYPEIAPVYETPIRRLVIASTGYGLFYSIQNRGVIVHALVHLSRSPETIRDRIRRILRLI